MKKIAAILAVVTLVIWAARSQTFATDVSLPQGKSGIGSNAKVEGPATLIKVNCRLAKTDAAGNEEVLSAPTVLTLCGHPARVTIGMPNGETLSLDITSSVVTQADTQRTAKAVEPSPIKPSAIAR
jgi:hypothetical protein